MNIGPSNSVYSLASTVIDPHAGDIDATLSLTSRSYGKQDDVAEASGNVVSEHDSDGSKAQSLLSGTIESGSLHLHTILCFPEMWSPCNCGVPIILCLLFIIPSYMYFCHVSTKP